MGGPNPTPGLQGRLLEEVSPKLRPKEGRINQRKKKRRVSRAEGQHVQRPGSERSQGVPGVLWLPRAGWGGEIQGTRFCVGHWELCLMAQPSRGQGKTVSAELWTPCWTQQKVSSIRAEICKCPLHCPGQCPDPASHSVDASRWLLLDYESESHLRRRVLRRGKCGANLGRRTGKAFQVAWEQEEVVLIFSHGLLLPAVDTDHPLSRVSHWL